MKKIYLFIVTIFLGNSLFAQSNFVSLTKDSFYVVGTNKDDLMKAEAKVKNNTTSMYDIIWEKIEITKPANWDVNICDPIACYLPTKNFSNFTLMPAASGDFIVDASPNGYAGEAHVRVKFTTKSNPNLVYIAKYKFKAPNISGTNDAFLGKINIVPNPTNDFFTIAGNDNNIQTVQIYNLTGRIVKAFTFGENMEYSVGELARGTYLVSLLDRNEKRLGTKKLIKTY